MPGTPVANSAAAAVASAAPISLRFLFIVAAPFVEWVVESGRSASLRHCAHRESESFYGSRWDSDAVSTRQGGGHDDRENPGRLRRHARGAHRSVPVHRNGRAEGGRNPLAPSGGDSHRRAPLPW